MTEHGRRTEYNRTLKRSRREYDRTRKKKNRIRQNTEEETKGHCPLLQTYEKYFNLLIQGIIVICLSLN
jgi:hypothetical protein